MTEIRYLRLDLAKGCRDIGHIRLSWEPEIPRWRVIEFNFPKTTEEPSQRRVVAEGSNLPKGFDLFTQHLVEIANDWEAGAEKEVARQQELRDREAGGRYRGFRPGWAAAEFSRLQNQRYKIRRQYRPAHRDFHEAAAAAGWPVGPYVEPTFSWDKV